MCDIAPLLNSFSVIPSLSKPSLPDRRLCVQTTGTHYSQFTIFSNTNTIGFNSAVCGLFILVSIDFMTLYFMLCVFFFQPPSTGFNAVQIAAAINISNQSFQSVATQEQTLYVFIL